MFTLKKQAMAGSWELVELGEAGSFEVFVSRAKWGDLLADSETFQGFSERRLKAVITDWRGLIDENGEAVPFSHEMLIELCEAHPLAFQRLATLASAQFFAVGLGETDRKNSAPPSSASTAEIPAGPVTTAESSNS